MAARAPAPAAATAAVAWWTRWWRGGGGRTCSTRAPSRCMPRPPSSPSSRSCSSRPTSTATGCSSTATRSTGAPADDGCSGYLLAIASLALLYSLAQAARHAHRMRGGVDPVSSASARLLDFVGDQVVAYLLMSALSAAVPITNRMRSAVVNNFTDATAAAISMAFFSFVALALSAVVSGYKLSKQTYM
ncbi:hypothetical protein SORBI_3001G402701 [Sorghum bicolor]|uniref:CASP-like protein n=1 Tax=Sorghum bicolor TaxID=4558 RepID=A0A1Z5S9Y1_SORBI|nr:hypothetical protein SORBI_3001G402701 [Sorghum bicolor]